MTTVSNDGTKPELNPAYIDAIINETSDYDRKKRKRIRIDKADMEIILIEFKDNVLSRDIFNPMLGLVALWSPYLTADFKSVFGASSEWVSGLYFGFSFVITFAMTKRWFSLIGSGHKKRRATTRPVVATNDPQVLADLLVDAGSGDP